MGIASLSLHAAAQNPATLPWLSNIDGARAVPEALALLQDHDVVFPEEIRLSVAELPDDTYATYLMPSLTFDGDTWGWSRFLNRFGEIPIRATSSVFESDEAIIAVLSHEAFELNGLREHLPDGHVLPGFTIQQLIQPGIPGNLHCQAWDHADRRIREWRARRYA